MRGRRAWGAVAGTWLFALASLVSACEQTGTSPPTLVAAGRVSDERGLPLAGVVVTDLQHSVLSDARGRFTLPVSTPLLRFSKPGYRVQELNAQAEKQLNIRLLRRSQRQTLVLHRAGADDAYQRLEKVMADMGRLLVLEELGALKAADVLLLPAPSSSAAGRTGQVLDWVKNGGRLILCGEWGGYPAADLETLNALSRPAGIVFTGATVRDPAAADFRLAVSASELPSAQKLSLTLFGATALEIRAPARAIVSLGAPIYSIQDAQSSVVVAAVAPWGAGKVFALGDSSLWRDEDSSGAGVANADLPGHRQFLQALLEW